MLGHVLHLDGVAQVRLVGAVFPHRLGVRDAREFRRHRLALAELLEHAAHDRLDGVEHVFLGDEAHLQIELIELSRRAVGARVLVAEAGGDLEVAVEARDHDQLLELLRRLRQRVEFSGMHAARHEIVARALRRGGGEDRRLKFEEACLAHAVAQRPDDRLPLHDVGMQALAAKIEEAVFEARLLRIVGLAEHRQRQLLGLGQDLDRPHPDLDLSRRQMRVDRLGRARHHLAVDAHHPFRLQPLGVGEGRRFRVHHALGNAVMVAEIDEQKAAMVAHAVDPAREPDGRSDILFPQLAAGFSAIRVHHSKNRSGLGGLRRKSAWDAPPCQGKRRRRNKGSASTFIGRGTLRENFHG